MNKISIICTNYQSSFSLKIKFKKNNKFKRQWNMGHSTDNPVAQYVLMVLKTRDMQ